MGYAHRLSTWAVDTGDGNRLCPGSPSVLRAMPMRESLLICAAAARHPANLPPSGRDARVVRHAWTAALPHLGPSLCPRASRDRGAQAGADAQPRRLLPRKLPMQLAWSRSEPPLARSSTLGGADDPYGAWPCPSLSRAGAWRPRPCPSRLPALLDVRGWVRCETSRSSTCGARRASFTSSSTSTLTVRA